MGALSKQTFPALPQCDEQRHLQPTTLYSAMTRQLQIRMPSMQHPMRLFVTLTLSALVSAFANAALPDPGMWVIGNELNGTPGRGLQIDRQGGKTVIVSYFGYRPDGSSLFLQASGTMQDAKNFASDLVEYKNGRAIAGSAKDGEFAQSHGPVSITFDSSTSGVITLPGEPPQALKRFNFEDLRIRLHGATYLHTIIGATATLTQGGFIRFEISGEQLLASEKRNDGTECTYRGTLEPTGKGFRSIGSVQCTDSPQPQTYRIEDLQADEWLMLSGRLYTPDEKETAHWSSLKSIVGVCIDLPGPSFSITPKPRCGPFPASGWAQWENQ